MTDDDKQWHLDKKVPLALIFAIACQTGGLLVWGSNLSTRVNQLEMQLAAVAPQAERIIRLETKMDAIFSNIAEIKAIVQRK